MKLNRTKERLDANDADISGSSFENVNLSGLKLTKANLAGASISGGRYDGMTIDGIEVSELLAAYRAGKSEAAE